MTLTKLFKTLCFAALGILALSCEKTTPYYYPDSVKVLKVEASTNFDLSARSAWHFLVHGCDYAFEIEGNKLIATPSKTSETFAFSVSITDNTGSAVIRFMPADYFKTRSTGGGGTIVPNIEDQSTPEKFMACDVLSGKYEGLAKEEIAITFFHENALLQFETIDLPDDAKVYIEQKYDQMITPLRDKEDPAKYQALVLPQNYPHEVYVIVEANGKIYKTPLQERKRTRTSMTFFDGLGQSALVDFNVRITDKDELVIEEYKQTDFVKAWPITQ